ncbi:MAG: putative molybdenum carrier protein [Desulfobacterales bacterium]
MSGGQSGLYQAALDAAIRYRFPHGGWIPKGRKTEEAILTYDYKPGALHSDASSASKALTSFCLFGLWPKIQATRFAGYSTL